MSAVELFDYVKNGGTYCAPLLLVALLWMNSERKALIDQVKDKDEKLVSLSERTIVIMTELKGLLSGRSSA